MKACGEVSNSLACTGAGNVPQEGLRRNESARCGSSPLFFIDTEMKGGLGGSKNSKSSKSCEEKKHVGLALPAVGMFFLGSAVDGGLEQGLFYIMPLWDGFG